MSFLKRGSHTKAVGQNPAYPPRSEVPDFTPELKWNAKEAPSYKPAMFEHGAVLAANRDLHGEQAWADPPDVTCIDWSLPGRKSYYGQVMLDAVTKAPINPVGRTGLLGRGLLGLFGPNHAGDLVMTRDNPIDPTKLDFVAIKRRDCGLWALPGGMVDSHEAVSKTIIREFTEEAMAHLKQSWSDEELVNFNTRDEVSTKARDNLMEIVESGGETIFKGYVDDPRNTDNAWIETTCMHYHCTAKMAAKLNLRAGDDAIGVKWMTVDDANPEYANLYASHKQWVDAAASKFSTWADAETEEREDEEDDQPRKRQCK